MAETRETPNKKFWGVTMLLSASTILTLVGLNWDEAGGWYSFIMFCSHILVATSVVQLFYAELRGESMTGIAKAATVIAIGYAVFYVGSSQSRNSMAENLTVVTILYVLFLVVPVIVVRRSASEASHTSDSSVSYDADAAAREAYRSARNEGRERISPYYKETAEIGTSMGEVSGVGDMPKRRPIPKNVKMYVWQRDRGRCVECGSKERLEYDHIIPVSKGGRNTDRNIQLLCEHCNRSKGSSIA